MRPDPLEIAWRRLVLAFAEMPGLDSAAYSWEQRYELEQTYQAWKRYGLFRGEVIDASGKTR